MSQPSQVESLFFAALEKKTKQELAAFLDSACDGDPEIRRRVERLLNAHLKVGDFLKNSVTEQLIASHPALDVTQLHGSDQGDGLNDGSLDFLQASNRSDSLGRLGHYEVLEVLGKGGFGIVFRAFDDTLHRVVAIKVLAPHLAATSPARKRFLREARSSAKVRHENIVQVHAVEEQPLPYLVMEFIPGETLQQHLDRTGPLETDEVVRIGVQICEGLAAAHAQGLIHRDIKPSNVLIEVGPRACVKITDFGLARTVDDASVTQSGIIAGTPMYMAPEQALGDTLDHRADLFSLGSVLYTMCSGRPPFCANHTIAVLKRVVDDTPRPIPEIIPEVPQWLCDIISKLHAKKPKDRIATAKEVVDLLLHGPVEKKSQDVSTPAEAAAVVPPAMKPRPRSRTGLWSIAATVLLLSGIGLSLSEANGVTNVRGTIIRLFSPEGTLVVEVDDSSVSVTIDGSDVVVTGAGAREIRLKPGYHTVEASKNGKLVTRELITVTNNGRQVVRVSQVSPPTETIATNANENATTEVATWEHSVAAMPAAEQFEAVVARLTLLNPGFDGQVRHTIENGVVTNIAVGPHVADISPLRALMGLRSFYCNQLGGGRVLVDLSPLRDLKLTSLEIFFTSLTDLSPLQGMNLTTLHVRGTRVSDLSPLKNMNLKVLDCGVSNVSDLSPLTGMMTLKTLDVFQTPVADLSPLKDLKLTSLDIGRTGVTDLSPLKFMKLTTLHFSDLGISDISLLKGLPLSSLDFRSSRVSDLSPLTEMKLTELDCAFTPVTDLTPLKGMLSMKRLHLEGSSITDLQPLDGMELEEIRFTPGKITRGLDILRDMKSLKIIGIDMHNGWTSEEFWGRYDKGEFQS